MGQMQYRCAECGEEGWTLSKYYEDSSLEKYGLCSNCYDKHMAEPASCNSCGYETKHSRLRSWPSGDRCTLYESGLCRDCYSKWKDDLEKREKESERNKEEENASETSDISEGEYAPHIEINWVKADREIAEITARTMKKFDMHFLTVGEIKSMRRRSMNIDDIRALESWESMFK